MPKGNLLEDTFEQLVELGQSTTKKTVKSVAQIFNPLSVFDKQTDERANSLDQQNRRTESVRKNNHTPLDFEKLQKKFKAQENTKTEALRNRLFQMVKQGDEKIVMENRQKELERKRREEYEKEEKKRREKEKEQQQQSENIPLGKIRRSIFSPKKVAERSRAEIKPAVGKQ